MNYWLVKTEPEEYSWDDLVAEKRCVWDGVKAPKALKNMSQMKPGDRLFIYHTGKERSIIGTGEVVSYPYPDPSENNPKLLVIEIGPLSKLNRPISLKEIKQIAAQGGHFNKWDLVRLPRLSVMPVSQEDWNFVLELSNKK